MPAIGALKPLQEHSPMAWPIPCYTKGKINRAGQILAAESTTFHELEWARGVLSNWRGSHAFPINTFQVTLRSKLRRLGLVQTGASTLVAQRLKRTSSIIAKLRRFDTMRLARMQDIGGVRAVVGNISRVRRLEADYKSSRRLKHELVSEKDYIRQPKCDGYRSVHLVFHYISKKYPKYNGLSIELQIRTQLQHAWATAVETMGTFLGQALKAREGEQEWLKFFEVTGAAFAHIERSPLVPGYEGLSRIETFERVREAEKDLGVLAKLRGFSVAVAHISEGRHGAYHLIVLDSSAKTVRITPYSRHMLGEAMRDYARVEAKADNTTEAVLVSAGPVALLRQAYPNYFLDTNEFVKRVESIIREADREE